MSSEVILHFDIVILLPPFIIYEHSFEIVSEKLSVGGQVQLEMPLERHTERRKERKRRKSNRTIMVSLTR